MTQDEINAIYSRHKLGTQVGRYSDTSTCNVKGCKRKDQFLLFDGLSKLSTLITNSCDKHLVLQTKKALAHCRAEAEKEIEEFKKHEIEMAKEILKTASI